MRIINVFFTLLFLVSIVTQWSCSRELFLDCLEGMGDEEIRVFNFEPIDEIKISGQFDLKIIEGTPQKIEVFSYPNLMDKLFEDSFVEDGELNLSVNGCIDIRDEIEVTVTIPKLSGISVAGDANIKTEGVFENIDDLKLEVNGEGGFKLDLGENINLIETQISGTGDFKLTGNAQRHSISISGTGDVKSFGLRTQNTDITISGTGDCEVFVDNILDVKVSGAGDVCYRGNPTVSQNISGSGKIDDCN